MRKAADQRHAQTISLLWPSFLLFHGGDVICFDVMKLLAGWDEVMWLVVRWRGVSYCGELRRDMSCHVMSFDAVVTFDAMWLLVLCHVTWCNTMSWWWAVICCALQWDGMLWAKDATGCKVTLCGSKCFCDGTTPVNSVLQRTTPVLQDTIAVLLCTTKHYSSTTLQSATPVLFQYYSAQLQYYSSTSLYYKELL